MQAAGADRRGELDGVVCALDVGAPVGLGVGGHVVDRREVEEVLDPVGEQRRHRLIGDSQKRLKEIPDQWPDPLAGVWIGLAPIVDQALQPRQRPLAREHVDDGVRDGCVSSRSTSRRPMNPVAPETMYATPSA